MWTKYDPDIGKVVWLEVVEGVKVPRIPTMHSIGKFEGALGIPEPEFRQISDSEYGSFRDIIDSTLAFAQMMLFVEPIRRHLVFPTLFTFDVCYHADGGRTSSAWIIDDIHFLNCPPLVQSPNGILLVGFGYCSGEREKLLLFFFTVKLTISSRVYRVIEIICESCSRGEQRHGLHAEHNVHIQISTIRFPLALLQVKNPVFFFPHPHSPISSHLPNISITPCFIHSDRKMALIVAGTAEIGRAHV